jgi:hypothetical protein
MELYKELAELLRLQKEIDEKVTTAKTALLEKMQESGEEKTVTEWGAFTLASRKSYTYSPTIKKMEGEVKLAKVKEEQDGTAEVKTTNYILFKEAK